MTFIDCTADLVGQLNGNGQKGMLQIDAPPVENFWLRHCSYPSHRRTHYWQTEPKPPLIGYLQDGRWKITLTFDGRRFLHAEIYVFYVTADDASLVISDVLLRRD